MRAAAEHAGEQVRAGKHPQQQVQGFRMAQACEYGPKTARPCGVAAHDQQARVFSSR